jgi:arabinofuranosyltransferase
MPDADLGPVPTALPDPDRAIALWFERYHRLILAVAILAALASSLLFFSFTADDAFISFRYGKNLVFHHIWNWNLTGPHEEAYTSATYTVLAIVPLLLHLPVVLFMKFIGMACVGTMIYRLRSLTGSGFAWLLGALLLGLSPVLWVHIYSCLETPLYMLLVLEMAIAVKRAEHVQPAWVYALFLLLPLTRPEGFVFASAGVLLFWKLRSHTPKQLSLFAVALLIGAVYFIARWKYFHHMLPNPFYVKVDHHSLRNLLRLEFVNLATYKGYILAVLLVSLVSRNVVTRVFALCSVFLMTGLFAPHLLAMNYADRFYLQTTLPIILIFFIVEDVARVSRLALAVAVLFIAAYSPSDWLLQLKYPANIKRAHIDLGKRLAPFSSTHTLLAGDVGAIPYYSNWFCFDSIGLGTSSIAQHPLTVDQLRIMNPDLVIVYNENPGPGLLHDGSWVGDPKPTGITIRNYLNASGEYDYAGSSRSNAFYLVSFLRKDAPQHDAILATLQQNSDAPFHEPSLKDILLQRYLPPLY